MADLEPSGSPPDSSYRTPRSEWKRIAADMDEFDPGDVNTADPEQMNRYIEAKAVTYEDDAEVISDEALWDIFQQDFDTFTEDHFKKAYRKARTPIHLLRSVLRRAGVFIPASNKKTTVAATMSITVGEEKKHVWTIEDVKELLTELKKGVVTSAVVREFMEALEPPTPQPIQEQPTPKSPQLSNAESNVQDIDTPSRPPRDLRTPANPPTNPPGNREPIPPSSVRFVDLPRNPSVDSSTAHQYYGQQQTQYPPLPPPSQYQPPNQPQTQPGYQLVPNQTEYTGYNGGYNGFTGGYQSVKTGYPPYQPQFQPNSTFIPPGYPQSSYPQKQPVNLPFKLCPVQ